MNDTPLHEGGLASNASGLFPHELKQNGSFLIVDGHMQGFERFQDELQISNGLCKFLAAFNHPSGPSIISKQRHGILKPFLTAFLPKH